MIVTNLRFALIFIFIVAIGLTPLQVVASTQHPETKITPSVFSRLSEVEQTKVWVFFSDKNIAPEHLATALEDAENQLSGRALERRARNQVEPLVTMRDLPVHAEYCDAVCATGAQLQRRSKWLNGISVTVNLEQVQAIAQMPFVRQIDRVRHFSGSDPLTPQAAPASTEDLDYGNSLNQLEQNNVVEAHNLGYSGAGILITMLDTGYNLQHESLADILSDGRLVAQYDFINDDDNVENETTDDHQQDDHGTVTWSTVGGYMEGQLIGPAYNASYILAKTEDVTSETPVEEDNWVAAIEWAEGLGTDVANSSLGYYEWYEFEDMDGNTAPITIAADIAASLGVIVCTSLGNQWGDHLGAPADADSVITVGSIDPEGNHAAHNAVGPTYDGRIKPEVMAQGVATYCADPDNPIGYITANGTSLASPLMAGCAALVLEANPGWTAMQVREALMMTAANANNPNNQIGWGTADVVAAINYNITNDFALTDFRAEQTPQSVKLSWSVSNEAGIVGYNIQRCESDICVYDPINPTLIPAAAPFFEDSNIVPGTEYYYQLEAIFEDGSAWQFPRQTVYVYETPGPLTLQQNYPNPFVQMTRFSFHLPAPDRVSFYIYNVTGQRVRALAEQETYPAGTFNLVWDGRNDNGEKMGSGTYFFHIETNQSQSTRQLTLLR